VIKDTRTSLRAWFKDFLRVNVHFMGIASYLSRAAHQSIELASFPPISHATTAHAFNAGTAETPNEPPKSIDKLQR
jgi:hypothetical protein